MAKARRRTRPHGTAMVGVAPDKPTPLALLFAVVPVTSEP